MPAANANKPIIALKSGVSAHGAAAAASHTGSLAGAAKVYGAAFQQAGVIQATDLDNLFDRTLALSLQPPMKGDNLLIITNGGGVGVLATDAAERYRFAAEICPGRCAGRTEETHARIRLRQEPGGSDRYGGHEWYYDSVKFAYAHNWVDGLVVLYCETAMTNPMEIAKGIKRPSMMPGVKDKPVTVSFVGGEHSADRHGAGWLKMAFLPTVRRICAVNAMAALREYRPHAKIVTEHGCTPRIKPTGKQLWRSSAKARAEGRDSLTEIEAKAVFALYGLPVTNTELANNRR